MDPFDCPHAKDDLPPADSTLKSHLAGVVTAFRHQYRVSRIPRYYAGWPHFWLTSLLSVGAIAVCFGLTRQVTWLEALTVPLTLLYSNLAEYLGHKGPMHHRWPLLSKIYLHTSVHHRFFTHDAFGYEQTRDFHALLLPPSILAFFFGFFALPVGVLLYFYVSPNVAYLCVATALLYFLSYEWLHFFYHAQEGSLALRIPMLVRLRHRHLLHHNPKLMSHNNFNITLPLFDWVFRTTHLQQPRPH